MSGNLDDTRLRALLREAHRDEEAPPFETVWASAEAKLARPERDGRAPAPWFPFLGPRLPRLALAAGVAASVLAVALLVRLAPDTTGTAGSTRLAQLAQLAQSAQSARYDDETSDWTWSDWTGPTDFLLDTPGAELLGSARLLDEQATISYETQTTQERTGT